MSCSNATPCKAGQREQFQAVILPAVEEAYESPIADYRLTPLINRAVQSACRDGRACTWWWITVHPKAILRSGVRNQTPPPSLDPQLFAPLPLKDILLKGDVSSSLKVKLTLSDSTSCQRELIVDVGSGFAIAWYGPAVKIDVLTFPDGARQLFPITKITPNFAGYTAQIVEDVVLESNVSPVDCCPSREAMPLSFTEVKFVTGGARDLLFNKPAGARRMAYMATANPPRIAFQASRSLDAGAATELGVIDPSPGLANPRTGSPINVPGPAFSLFVSDAPNGHYSVIWEIQP